MSIDRRLLREAKALKVNLSRTLERRLAEIVAENRREEWLRSNAEAIESYNRRIERQGVFSDGLRRF